MYYIEKYNKNKLYLFQDGKFAGYEQLKELYPSIDDFTYIVFTDYSRQIILFFQLLNLKRTELNIDPALSEDDAIEQIVQIMNTEEQGFTPDNQTRIADALEDLVVLNMPDEEE